MLADILILGQFLLPGEWTSKIVAKLADGTCSFAMSITQKLEGTLRWNSRAYLDIGDSADK